MSANLAGTEADFVHFDLGSGVEFAADRLPHRDTVALNFRMLSGVAHDPTELTGLGSLISQTFSKGTRKYDGRGLADAFDALGAQWGATCGRQSTVLRVVCLPEFALDAVDLVVEMLRYPTFPDEACTVAVELAQQDLRSIEDDASELIRILIQRLTLGPVYGRHPGGDAETLARVTPEAVRLHWKQAYRAGRMQVAAAGPLNAEALAKKIDKGFAGWGSPHREGREPMDYIFRPAREHRAKDLQQQYIAITLPAAAREHPDFPLEQVAIGVLSGGMSGRLFTEVREKQGLVYWVGAWHEQPRGAGIIHLGASTTPERCAKTYETLLGELHRLSKDLTDSEVARARDSLIAHAETEDDITRARAANLSDDLFHFSRPIGLSPKLDALRAVTVERVREYVRRLRRDYLCVATLGTRELFSGAGG